MPNTPQSPPPLSARKEEIQELANNQASEREKWIKKNAFYYKEDERYMRFLIPEGKKILDLGCGNGSLLASLKPSYGLGVDLSPKMIEVAQSHYPNLHFACGDVEDSSFMRTLESHGPFDFIVLSDTIGSLEDCQATLNLLHPLCSADTRIIVSYYSRMWAPLLKMARMVGLQMPHPDQNWLSTDDIANFLDLSQYETIKREWRQLLPRNFFGLGYLVNRYIAPLPIVRRLCLRNYIVARSLKQVTPRTLSATVLIPCRNEKGNIEPAIERLPAFCQDIEIIYVEGGSKDGTPEEIQRVIAKYPQLDIKVLTQDGKGKGDAVRKGFAHARGDVLMILDADLTMPPEALPKFYDAIASGKGEFINGTRLVYPMEQEAMRFLNLLANQTFSWLFSWLLNQRFTDTLCGTKVLTKKHYEAIAANRKYFGDFDPFGDFDLIFGASKLNLKVVEIPITYASRRYGETQISRFRHGVLLLGMVIFAFKKLKAF
jgi:SAM-dependent methyltransferase